MGLADYIDDIGARVNQIGSYLPEDINAYLKNRATEEFIKATNGQKGNQTADQIAKGQYGQAQGVASSTQNPALNNALSASQILSTSFAGVSLPVLVLGVLGVVLLLRKGK